VKSVANRIETKSVENAIVIGNIIAMKTISVPMAEARMNFCDLVEQVKTTGVRVVLTSYGQAKAQIIPCAATAAPWRVNTPDDPKRYGDLQSPVMEEWQ
jgi:prevent-host-death family protein